jgi:hypothetical protein
MLTEVWIANNLTNDEETYVDDIMQWVDYTPNLLDAYDEEGFEELLEAEWQEVWRIDENVFMTREEAEEYAQAHDYSHVVRVTKEGVRKVLKDFINEYERYSAMIKDSQF